jgi:uncharacterized protein (TIGR02270 family)
MNWGAASDVLLEIVEQHVTEAAFSWTMRDAAAHSPAYDLLELCELDDRLECHLDGLRASGEAGWELCLAALDDAEPGAIFVAALLAVEREDWKHFARVLDATAESPGAARELVSALGWLPFDRLALVWRGMLTRDAPPILLRFGIAGHAIHRRDAGSFVAAGMVSAEVELRARAFRAVGELQRHDLKLDLRAGYADADLHCRFWSAWSGALLRDLQAQPVLAQLAETSERFGARAAELAARTLDSAEARTLVQTLAARGPIALRSAIAAAGALGDPALAPWLLSLLEDPEHARPAAWSLGQMCNANVAEQLDGKPPEGFVSGPNDDPDDEDVAMDPDEDLPWPDPARLAAWYKERAGSFREGTRYFLGQPIDPTWLRHVLRSGNQLARAGAAVELCLRHRDEPLFEVRAPAFHQLATLRSGG